MEGKTDTQNTSPIKFRPMPKRFIVWTGKDFYRERDKNSPSGPNSKIDGKIKVFELRTLSILAHFPNIKVKAVCQCTGLLDCKAQFIYEGSILRLKSGHIGYVYLNKRHPSKVHPTFLDCLVALVLSLMIVCSFCAFFLMAFRLIQ